MTVVVSVVLCGFESINQTVIPLFRLCDALAALKDETQARPPRLVCPAPHLLPLYPHSLCLATLPLSRSSTSRHFSGSIFLPLEFYSVHLLREVP